MDAIVTVTVATDALDADVKAELDREASSLGLGTALQRTEGGGMSLPQGTYGAIIEVGDQMAQTRAYYRGVVDIMKRLGLEGKYFVCVARHPTFVCGEL